MTMGPITWVRPQTTPAAPHLGIVQQLKGSQQLPGGSPGAQQWVTLEPGGPPAPHIQPNIWGAHAPPQEITSTLQGIA